MPKTSKDVTKKASVNVSQLKKMEMKAKADRSSDEKKKTSITSKIRDRSAKKTEKSGMSTLKSVGKLERKSKTEKHSDDKNHEMKDFEKQMHKMLGRTYHGVMPREECEALLVNEGDFLVRFTHIHDAPTFCISVLHRNTCRHVAVRWNGNSWTVNDITRPTLSELIDYLVTSHAPINITGHTIKKPICRPDYYLLHCDISPEEKVGAGAYGEVYCGKFRRKNEEGAVEEVKCAIKQIKDAVTKQQMKDFLKEAKLMRRLNHPNIVRLFGIALQEMPVMIVLEFAPNGSDFLRKNPEYNVNSIFGWVADAVRGMAYLAGRAIIHRDLAARNCLLGEKMELKIADFGLSVADYSQLTVKELKKMPVRWLAPETLLKGIFTEKTDVWSLGILIWELYSYCKTDPFPGLTNAQAREQILSGQQPLAIPSNCPSNVADQLQRCWTQDSETRPTFSAVLTQLCPNETPPKPLEPWEIIAE